MIVENVMKIALREREREKKKNQSLTLEIIK